MAAMAMVLTRSSPVSSAFWRMGKAPSGFISPNAATHADADDPIGGTVVELLQILEGFAETQGTEGIGGGGADIEFGIAADAIAQQFQRRSPIDGSQGGHFTGSGVANAGMVVSHSGFEEVESDGSIDLAQSFKANQAIAVVLRFN